MLFSADYQISLYVECPLRFSRLRLNVDTGVSTVSFAEDDQGFDIIFEATSFPLPIVQGPADFHLPPGCIVSALAVNRATGWRTVNRGGFNIRQSHNDAFLQVLHFNEVFIEIYSHIDSQKTIAWSPLF